MGKNRGKQFEAEIKKAFEHSAETHYLLRLYDPGFGFKSVKNFADFVLFVSPYLFFLECKSTDGGTFNFTQITDNQIEGLYKAHLIHKVMAGVIVWFKEKDFTCFIPIQEIARWKKLGYKSIAYNSIDSLHHIVLSGEKRRALFTYNADQFIQSLKRFAEEQWGS